MSSGLYRLAGRVDVASWSDATHERNMRLAVNAARRAALGDELRVGAVIVDSACRVVAAGSAMTNLLCDPTAHAETVAIRGAAVKARRPLLRDFVLYTTLEPCSMCFGACVWAELGGVVYGADASTVRSIRLDRFASETIRRKRSGDGGLFVRGRVLVEETTGLLGDVGGGVRHHLGCSKAA
jgi:tRNA(adenine34) deaminase